jgi:hypothetical protein
MPAAIAGTAVVACVSGCRCKRLQLDVITVLEVDTGIAATEVSSHCQG